MQVYQMSYATNGHNRFKGRCTMMSVLRVKHVLKSRYTDKNT